MASLPIIQDAQNVRRVTLKTGVTVVAGDLLGYNAGWVKADADGPFPALLMAMERGDGDGGVVTNKDVAACASGTLHDVDAPFTAGAAQWLSATAGAFTATKPALSTTLTLHQKIGQALDTKNMMFDLGIKGQMVMAIQASINPASIAATTKAEQSVTATGVLATDFVIVQAPASVENDIAVGHVRAAADTIELAFSNIDNTNAVDGAALTWVFLVLRNA